MHNKNVWGPLKKSDSWGYVWTGLRRDRQVDVFINSNFYRKNPEMRYEEVAERLWNLTICFFSVTNITVIPVTDMSAAAISWIKWSCLKQIRNRSFISFVSANKFIWQDHTKRFFLYGSNSWIFVLLYLLKKELSKRNSRLEN